MLLKRTTTGWVFACPACDRRHVFLDSWEFDGNLASPSVKHSLRIRGRWSELISESDDICHVSISKGNLIYHADCTHCLKGQTIPMVELDYV